MTIDFVCEMNYNYALSIPAGYNNINFQLSKLLQKFKFMCIGSHVEPSLAFLQQLPNNMHVMSEDAQLSNQPLVIDLVIVL